MLIVIEGLDGSGKSTQVDRMRKFLSTRTENLKYVHFPRYDAPVYGNLIGRFLKGAFGSIESVHPNLVALLFAEDRHGAAPEIRKALDSGATVLLDRYVYSNIAYQCAKLDSPEARSELRDWIFRTEYEEFGIPNPDLNIFLDVPISFVEGNLNSVRVGGDREYLDGGRDIHESDMHFQSEVRRMYLEQCEMDPSFIRVDCSCPDNSVLPPDEIFARLKQIVEDFLK